MDFWASLDHKLKYKKDNLKHPEIIAKEFKKVRGYDYGDGLQDAGDPESAGITK